MELRNWIIITGFYVLCFYHVDSQALNISCPSNHYKNVRVGCVPCGKCLNLPCGVNEGTCDNNGCANGYVGRKCNKKCTKGRYGRNCQKQCNTKCLDNNCNSINGFCHGCILGYTGRYCQRECSPGTYGWRCLNNCSSCLDNECDPQTGYCIECPSGYIGERCTLECQGNTYGVNCSNSCHHCSGLQCDKTTGQCFYGCNFGYYGDNCDSEFLRLLHGFLYGFLLVVVLFLIGLLIYCLRRRQRPKRDSESISKQLRYVQHCVGGYKSYSVSTGKEVQPDRRSVDLSPPESPSPRGARKFGSFLSKRVAKDKPIRLEPEGSQLPNDDVTDRKSGYIDVVRKPEMMSDNGYIVVTRHVQEEDYANYELKLKDSVRDSEEIYENSEPSVNVRGQSVMMSEPLYENVKLSR